MLASPYRLHAAVAGSFPPQGQQGGEGRVLWRVDRDGAGAANLYLVSPMRPSLVGLDEQIGWPDLEPQWVSRDYCPFLDGLATGQVFRFRLTANPVVSRSGLKDAKSRSRRIPHLTALQQSAWLAGTAAYDEAGIDVPLDAPFGPGPSRAERNGFAIVRDGSGALQLQVSDSRTVTFHKGEGSRPVTLATARYDGLLEVLDAPALRRALVGGIGHGKGFGCGLLTLSPAARP